VVQDDDLGVLVASFNRMQAGLAERQRLQQPAAPMSTPPWRHACLGRAMTCSRVSAAR
jgi:hypothetical protein